MKIFLDTNVLVYWQFATEKADIVEGLLATHEACISVQVLNELANVLRKKHGFDLAVIKQISQTLQDTCQVMDLTVQTHKLALDIAARYKLSLYDACIFASTAQSGCSVLMTEDMQHGQSLSVAMGNNQAQKISLSVRNPFI